jgi:dTDP-4-dehydrorhamnose 3,5-epimerase
MIFTETALKPAWLIDLEPLADERGFFARTFCQNEFARHGLPQTFVQSSISFNRRQGTLRGLHYQAEPAVEGKLVRCTRGIIFDVMVDLRRQAPTYCRWQAFELSAENGRAVYIPPGFAHGFQSLSDNTEVSYQMTSPYLPDRERGIRWNDRVFAIAWPLPDPILSRRDASYLDFTP